MKKKLKFAKPKRIKKSVLKKQCDVLFSKIIRSKGVCEARGLSFAHCGGNLQCAHLISRWNLRLRWEYLNALCLCAGHHRYFTNRPLEWAEFITNNFRSQYDFVMKYKHEEHTETFEETLNRLKVT